MNLCTYSNSMFKISRWISRSDGPCQDLDKSEFTTDRFYEYFKRTSRHQADVEMKHVIDMDR